MSKTVKYTIGILAAFLLIYLSLDIQKLDDHKAIYAPATFDLTDYTNTFWNDSLPVCIENATELLSLMQDLDEVPESVFEKYGHKLGISTTYYFMVKGKGTIEKIDADYLLLQLENQKSVKIATDFIFGNAVRDGSGKVNINDFMNMTDFNKVSVAINKLVKEKVVAQLRKSAVIGSTLEFVGATEINEEKIDLSDVLFIPVSVKLSDGQSE